MKIRIPVWKPQPEYLERIRALAQETKLERAAASVVSSHMRGRVGELLSKIGRRGAVDNVRARGWRARIETFPRVQADGFQHSIHLRMFPLRDIILAMLDEKTAWLKATKDEVAARAQQMVSEMEPQARLSWSTPGIDEDLRVSELLRERVTAAVLMDVNLLRGIHADLDDLVTVVFKLEEADYENAMQVLFGVAA